ncbi:MAG: cytochrome C oxidase subunit IV family protein [Myxococcales bacterium]|nr:cytochrome C oxidase subunit IV family protein [Myxococcales bacterium]
MTDHNENDGKHDEPEEKVTSSEESEESTSDESAEIFSEESSEPAPAKSVEIAAAKEEVNEDNHSGGLAQVVSVKALLGTFCALMLFPVTAVFVESASNISLLVAMVVATIQAGLICMYFMHLRKDKAMHTVFFLSALLLTLVFVSFALMDGSEYQEDTTWGKEAAR